MYTENPFRDVAIVLRAIAINTLAMASPSLYLRLARNTGRGSRDDRAAHESASDAANYFLECFDDYFDQLGIERQRIGASLAGKTVLEYGPGDVLGVALLMYAHGAARVQCVDRFPLVRMTEKNAAVYRRLLQVLEPPQRERAAGAFRESGVPESGFRPEAIDYAIAQDGVVGDGDAFDIVISRAVLEHVNDLDATIADIKRNLRPGGTSVHKVDLSDHGIDRYQPFDFLTWPQWLYRLMFSHRGFPNRWRLDRYRAAAARSGLRFRTLVPTGKVHTDRLQRVQPRLAGAFRGIPLEELAWSGFWMVLEHEDALAPAAEARVEEGASVAAPGVASARA